MTQYVVQIVESSGFLLKCYEVTPESPIRTEIAPGAIQVVLTDTAKYDAIVSVFEEYGSDVVFSYDAQTEEITWEIQNP